MPALEQHLIYRNRILTYSRLLMQLYCTCDKIFVVIIFIQNYTVLGRFKKQLLLRAAACCCMPAACWCVLLWYAAAAAAAAAAAGVFVCAGDPAVMRT